MFTTYLLGLYRFVPYPASNSALGAGLIGGRHLSQRWGRRFDPD